MLSNAFSSEDLCASIVRSHRETSQYRLEELQALRWKLFSREEIQAYQSKASNPSWTAVSSSASFFTHSSGRLLCNFDGLKAKDAILHALRLTA